MQPGGGLQLVRVVLQRICIGMHAVPPQKVAPSDLHGFQGLEPGPPKRLRHQSLQQGQAGLEVPAALQVTVAGTRRLRRRRAVACCCRRGALPPHDRVDPQPHAAGHRGALQGEQGEARLLQRSRDGAAGRVLHRRRSLLVGLSLGHAVLRTRWWPQVEARPGQAGRVRRVKHVSA